MERDREVLYVGGNQTFIATEHLPTDGIVSLTRKIDQGHIFVVLSYILWRISIPLELVESGSKFILGILIDTIHSMKGERRMYLK